MKFGLILLILLSALACSKNNLNANDMENQHTFNVQKSEEEWKKELTPQQFQVLREAATEQPFTGEYNLKFDEGVYRCAACGAELFSSDSKFKSNCGWPSFDAAISDGKIIEKKDTSHGMIRTEILCANCGSHLGHVFDDGPTDTGLRYCVNSISLEFDNDSIPSDMEN